LRRKRQLFFRTIRHFLPVTVFLAQAAEVAGRRRCRRSLSSIRISTGGTLLENDEHPPTDIQRDRRTFRKW